MWIPSFFYELMPVVYLMAGVLSIRTLNQVLVKVLAGSLWQPL